VRSRAVTKVCAVAVEAGAGLCGIGGAVMVGGATAARMETRAGTYALGGGGWRGGVD